MQATPSVISTRHGAWIEVRLDRPPANAINQAVVDELHAAIDACEADPGVQGVLFVGRARMFSAGLDVVDLQTRDRAEMSRFWDGFGRLVTRLYGTSLVTVAAIEGHAPAGGCVLAMVCDYRVMAKGRYKIGLNEVAVGLAVPAWLAAPYIGLVGQRVAERNLQLGRMVTPSEALAMGLVDAVEEQNEVRAAAVAELELRLSLPDAGRRRTKQALRGATAATMETERAGQLEEMLEIWFSEECRTVMGQLVARLGK